MNDDAFPQVPYRPACPDDAEAIGRARAFFERMDARRSVRAFADRPVPRACIESALAVANTAPSGAHMQPWTWVVVDDPALKAKIREAAEAEERLSYEGGRMSEEWLEALRPLGTDWRKPFLEVAPYLVVCFEQRWGVRPDGSRRKHYYVGESVGIACGLFITAIHEMGLATLTHTPSPMRFLSRLLRRPDNERPFILFPVGFPADDATVPDLTRKPLSEIVQWNDGDDGGA